MKKLEVKSAVNAKTGRLDAACERYGLGKTSMRQLASDAGAVVHIGKSYLINFSILDEYMDKHSDCV